MRYAFTGPSHLGPAGERLAREAVEQLTAPTEITTGAAHGWDTLVCRAALELWPGALHRIFTPGARFNRDGVLANVELARQQRARLELITLAEPHRGGARIAYRQRNTAMVDHADVVVAAVRHEGSDDPVFYRSGEWMTVNIALKAKKPVRFVPLPLDDR